MTLHFLGTVAASRADEVLALAATLPVEATEATIRELTGFPTAKRARAWVARLSVDARLEQWVAELRARWPTGERHRFDPHLTLARGRGLVLPESDALVGMPLALTAPAAYRSETLPEGARYSRLG